MSKPDPQTADTTNTAALLSDLRDPRFDGPLNKRAADEIERLRAALDKIAMMNIDCRERTAQMMRTIAQDA